MNYWKGHYLVIAIVVLFTVLGMAVWHEHRIAQGYRELALTITSVTSVTVYDVNCGRSFCPDASSNDLSTTLSAPFPLGVFTSGAGSATFHNQTGMWKGAFLAVLTLRDGSQRRARLSNFGGGFALDGVPGLYVVRGGQDSEFFRTLKSILREQILPKRDGQKKPPNKEALQPAPVGRLRADFEVDIMCPPRLSSVR
jgi:hypothetical protein